MPPLLLYPPIPAARRVPSAEETMEDQLVLGALVDWVQLPPLLLEV